MNKTWEIEEEQYKFISGFGIASIETIADYGIITKCIVPEDLLKSIMKDVNSPHNQICDEKVYIKMEKHDGSGTIKRKGFRELIIVTGSQETPITEQRLYELLLNNQIVPPDNMKEKLIKMWEKKNGK